MAEVFEYPVAYQVSVWPRGGETVNSGTWSVTVAYRGRDKWAVLRGGPGSRTCLGTGGEWDYEPGNSNREDDWLAAHRFGLDDALALAREHAPKVSVMGKTALDILAMEESGEIYRD